MKKITLLFGIFITGLVFGQKEFSISPNEFARQSITDISGKKEVLYKKSIEWISRKYQNPDKSILSKISGEFIRFQGIENVYCDSSYNTCYPTRYVIEISFKDNKYKFELKSLEINNGRDGFRETRLISDPSGYFRQNGEPFDKATLAIPKHFNELSHDLSDYILGKKSKW